MKRNIDFPFETNVIFALKLTREGESELIILTGRCEKQVRFRKNPSGSDIAFTLAFTQCKRVIITDPCEKQIGLT